MASEALKECSSRLDRLALGLFLSSPICRQSRRKVTRSTELGGICRPEQEILESH